MRNEYSFLIYFGLMFSAIHSNAILKQIFGVITIHSTESPSFLYLKSNAGWNSFVYAYLKY